MRFATPESLGQILSLILRSVGHCELAFASCELTNFMRENIGAK